MENLLKHVENGSENLPDLFFQPLSFFLTRIERFKEIITKIDDEMSAYHYIYFANLFVFLEREKNEKLEDYMKKPIDLYEKALKQEIPDELRNAAYSNLGLALAYRQQFFKSSEQEKRMFEVLNICSSENIKYQIVNQIRLSVAHFNSTNVDREAMIGTCKNVLRLCADLSDEDPILSAKFEALAIHDLGNLYLWHDPRDFDKAEKLISKAVSIITNEDLFKEYSCPTPFVGNLKCAYTKGEIPIKEIMDREILDKLKKLYKNHYEMSLSLGENQHYRTTLDEIIQRQNEL